MTAKWFSSSTAINNPQAYRPDIDGLRAIAILSVVIFHAFPKFLRGGFAGVDVFFVISGYLIANIIFKGLDRGRFSLAEFYAHRVRRIFPALILMLMFCLAFGRFALLPGEYAQLGKHMAAGVGFFLNLVLWQESGYFDTDAELKPLMHLWSLAIEEQFYLVYPAVAWLSWRLKRNRLPLILALGVLSFLANLNNIGQQPVSTFFLPQYRAWELLAGACLTGLPTATLPPRHTSTQPNSRIIHIVSAIGLMLLLSAFVVLRKERPFPGWWALLPVSGTCLLIVSGSTAWINRRLLAARPLVFIGLISYPLYLWHWPLLSLVRIVDAVVSVKTRLILIGLSFLLAWLTWRFWEVPIRYKAKTRFTTAILCGFTAMLGLSGYKLSLQQKSTALLSDSLLASIGMAAHKQTDKPCQKLYPSLGDMEFCSLTMNIKPSLALLGDSHGAQLYSGLVSGGMGVMNLGRNSCPPFFNTGFGKAGTLCPIGYMNKALELAIAEPGIHTIALAGRFAAYYSGNTQIDRPRISEDIPLLAHGISGKNAEVFRYSLRNTLIKLVNSGKNIVIVLDMPELDFNPNDCLRPFTLFAERRNPCAIPKESVESRTHGYRELVNRILKDFPTVKLFDPVPLFCDERYCWASKDERLMYRDDDHLSRDGSEYVGKHLGPLLQSLPQ